MTELLGLLLLIAALVPYGLGPLIVRFRRKFPSRRAFEPYDAARPRLSADLDVAFRATVDGLAAEGFHLVADLLLESPATKRGLRGEVRG